MKLYIVMPVINCLDFTIEAYKSIKSSLWWEFILMDQDSNDGTNQWGHDMVGDKFHYFLNSPRTSLAKAWNQGIRKAFEDPDCQYVNIANNDIVYHPKTLDNLVKFMDKSGYLLVTADNIASRMSKDTMLQMELPEPYTDYDLQKIEGWRAEGPDFSNFMINRKTIEVVGWFDEKFEGAYCEDWDFHKRIQVAREWAEKHNDQGIDPERIHAKRLSTAPYFHYASQTLKHNAPLRSSIATYHAKNLNRYLTKWGADHEKAMDGGGNKTPFGDASKNWRDW